MLYNFTKATLLILLAASTAVHAGNLITLASQPVNPKNLTAIQVLNASASETELLFTLQGFTESQVQTSQGPASVLSSSKLTPILEARAPDLAKMAVSLTIPDQTETVVD